MSNTPPIPNPVQQTPPPPRRPRRQSRGLNLNTQQIVARFNRFMERYGHRQYLPYWIGGGALVLVAVALVTVLLVLMIAVLFQPRIADGVSVAGIGVGGLTTQEASDRLSEQFASRQITLVDLDRQWQVPIAALGVSFSIDEAVQQAVSARADAQITPQYRVDIQRATDGLVALSPQVNLAPVDGNPPINGRTLDIPSMVDRLRADATGELADGLFELNMIELPAVLLEGATGTGEFTIHRVEAGDGLAGIALEYGVTLAEILAINPEITDANILQVGQEIRIPNGGTP
jgi:hypothetical protein